jgi:phosphogluconate dehydratase
MSSATSSLHPRIAEVTARIRSRSQDSRAAYLQQIDAWRSHDPSRLRISCTNLAHASAAFDAPEKQALLRTRWPNLGIVSAYNDMLSAHQPYERFPSLLKLGAREVGAVAQFAGGVPAMCDGVTQGQPGMELSLFSRDVIAMSTAVALSHHVFDAALCLGICDKIVPGLLMGALSFGHLPTIFVPGGPMPSGLPNKEKARIRQLHAEGKVGEDALLDSEAQSYHSPGTCTFYGTANSNQIMMELMGLHLPGAAFVNPNTPLRDVLTIEAAKRAARITALGDEYLPIGEMVDERSIVNAIVGLLATGGSTNHTMHVVAFARAAGVHVNWDDFSDLSDVVPLLARIYPNGAADVNHFHAAGGVGFLTRELLRGGLLHADVRTVVGTGLHAYTQEPYLSERGLQWRDVPEASGDTEVLRSLDQPFAADGGLKRLNGNIGRAVIKTSAVKPEHRVIEAPARVFATPEAMIAEFKAGRLDRDFVAVIPWQGPRANGMPELHTLTPTLGALLGRGYKVGLVTDGRMSGASGIVPAAIHVTPEALSGGFIGRIRDGDIIRLDSLHGVLDVKVERAELTAREPSQPDLHAHTRGIGRELFASFRHTVTTAEQGAIACGL